MLNQKNLNPLDDSQAIDAADHYTYLSITFSSSGSFLLAAYRAVRSANTAMG